MAEQDSNPIASHPVTRPLSDALVYFRFAGDIDEKPITSVLHALDADARWHLSDVPIPDIEAAAILGPGVRHAQKMQSDGSKDGPIVVFGRSGVGLLWIRDEYPRYGQARVQIEELLVAASPAYTRRPIHQVIWRYRDEYTLTDSDDAVAPLQWPADPLFATPLHAWTFRHGMPLEGDHDPRLELQVRAGLAARTGGDQVVIAITDVWFSTAQPNAGVSAEPKQALGVVDLVHVTAKRLFWRMLNEQGRTQFEHLFTDEERADWAQATNDRTST